MTSPANSSSQLQEGSSRIKSSLSSPPSLADPITSYTDDFTSEASSHLREGSSRTKPSLSSTPTLADPITSYADDFTSELSSRLQEGSFITQSSLSTTPTLSYPESWCSFEIEQDSSAPKYFTKSIDEYTSSDSYTRIFESKSLSSLVSSGDYLVTSSPAPIRCLEDRLDQNLLSKPCEHYDVGANNAARSYQESYECDIETNIDIHVDTTVFTALEVFDRDTDTHQAIHMLKDFNIKPAIIDKSKIDCENSSRMIGKGENARYRYINQHVQRLNEELNELGIYRNCTGCNLKLPTDCKHHQPPLPDHHLSQLERLKLENVTRYLEQKSRELDEQIKEHQNYAKRSLGSSEADGRFFFLLHKHRLQKDMQEKAIEQHQLNMDSVNLIGNLAANLPRHNDHPASTWKRLMETAQSRPNTFRSG